MLQPGADTWLMPDSLQADQLLDRLAEHFFIATAPEYSATVVYVDSFDWRLYQRGYILHCHERSWTLYHGESGEVTVQQGGPKLAAPCFAHDFPAGVLRDVLASVLGCRCLLPMATLKLAGHQLRLLNRDQKTVARLVLEKQQPVGAKAVYNLIRLFGIRGYDQELAEVHRTFTENGIETTISPLIGFEEGCKAAGRRPLDYASKFSMDLDGALSARQTMVQIYRQLLTTMERNLAGVLQDWDIEFLHDLRVALRRTRSGLSLVKEVLPDAVVAKFKRDLSTLGSITGPTRDLDVYLLQQDDYIARLPVALQPGMRGFFTALAARRRVEQSTMVRALKSRKVKSILAAWKQYLEKPADRKPAPEAGTAIEDLAGALIYRRYKKVIKDGQGINAATPDAEVHQLRIQCKKLRYALEFFSSLYPEKDMQLLLRQLKKLQDILGTFNDLSVQQQLLQHTLGGLNAQSRGSLETAAALGGLMQSLFVEQQALRTHFAETFGQFSDPENTSMVSTLFGKKQGER